MLSRIIDISIPLDSDMPVWPGSEGFQLSQTMSMETGDEANVSLLRSDVHVGTHIDAPWHMLNNGQTVEDILLDKLIGPAILVHFSNQTTITPSDLESLNMPEDTRRLLLRTRNSRLWAEGIKQFREDYTALTADAAQWVVDRGIHTVGIDYLSVQLYRDDKRTHEILLGAGVAIIECLNLSGVEAGRYELICLPIYLLGCDGAPARAVLRPLELDNTSG